MEKITSGYVAYNGYVFTQSDADFYNYEQFLKTVSDRDLIRLWIDYCAPRENDGGKNNPNRACAIHYEMSERGLL